MRLGMEHNQIYDEIRKKFFNDVKNYEEVIGSRKEIDRLKSEIDRIKKELKSLEIENYKRKRKIQCISKNSRMP